MWYGQCHLENEKPKNCPYTGPPKLLDSEGQVILKKWCPHIKSVETCCDTRQLESLDTNIELAANFLQRCPSCLQNLVQHICDFTCAPDQSRFMNVSAFDETADGQPFINGVDIHITDKYLSGTYNSCKQVFVPSAGQLALDVMCGPWGASRCSPQKWFSYMGDTNNPFVPFQINYLVSEVPVGGFKPLDPLVTPCNKGIRPDIPACSCVDCEASCPVPPPEPPKPDPFTLLGLEGVSVIMTIVFVIGSLLFLMCVYCCTDSTRNNIASLVRGEGADPVGQRLAGLDQSRIALGADEEESPLRSKRSSVASAEGANIPRQITNEDISFIEKLGAATDRFLESFFRWWGIYCATNPWFILFCGMCVIVGLGHGVKYMIVTTNPVELWASPTSRSRVEREFFDKEFEPFYRTEQVIIHAVGLPNVVHNTSNGPIEFGPVFNKEFLTEILKLQREIEFLGHNEGNGLDKICFAPFSTSTSKVHMSQCLVQSLWGYFQNDEELVEEEDEDIFGFTVNYMDHIKRCSQNPYNPECLAPYGGPVDPSIALGGFIEKGDSVSPQPKFEKATAVILTFLVNNYHNKTHIGPALQWEKLFIDFMKNWTSQHKPVYMDVAFSSERSIEDELDRGSHSDVVTILVSYVIMFGYIAISLGQMNSCNRLLVDSKITLGLGGVVIVLASVVCSVGLFGFVGVPATLIIIEVIPFLVLAVGVDNIFILVQTHQREGKQPYESHEEHIGRTLGQVT